MVWLIGIQSGGVRLNFAHSRCTGSLFFILDTYFEMSYILLLLSDLTISLNLLWSILYVSSP